MTEQANTEHPNTRGRADTGEPRSAAVFSWAVLFGAFALSADTWIALARLSGFTDQLTLAVSGVRLHFALAWLMPVVVDGYVVTALILWTAPVPAEVAEFARKNTYAAAGIGVLAQAAYHALTTYSATQTLWRSALAMVVGMFAPGFSALAVHMRALVRRHSNRANMATVRPATRPNVTRPPAVRPPAAFAPPPPNTTAPASTPPIEQANTERPDTKPVRPPASRKSPDGEQSNVRPISDARAAKLQAIKDANPGWRTNVPSVRECARILKLSPSSALPYQQELVREANTPATGDPNTEADKPEPERVLVAAGQ